MLPDHPPPPHRLQGLPAVSLSPSSEEKLTSLFSDIFTALQNLSQRTAQAQAAQDLLAIQRLIRFTAGKSLHLVNPHLPLFISQVHISSANPDGETVIHIFFSLFVWTDLTSLRIILLQAIAPPRNLPKKGGLQCIFQSRPFPSFYSHSFALIPFAFFPFSLFSFPSHSFYSLSFLLLSFSLFFQPFLFSLIPLQCELSPVCLFGLIRQWELGLGNQ